jgi:hypothetical protein
MMEVNMKVSQEAQSKLRVLLARASVLVSEVMEKERTSPEAFDATPAITRVALDLYALGFEAFQATDQSVVYWADEFEGILYCLTRSVTEALQACSPQQVKLLRKLKVVVTRIDEWHTAFIAADTTYVVEAEECPPECIFHPDHPGLVYAKK